MGFLTKTIYRFVDSSIARSAVTLVVPFAVYIAAEHFHASGVIAVVVTALEIRRNSRPQDADERITSKSFWEVVEMLATGVAFGLVGLEIRHVIAVEGEDIYRLLIPAGIVCVLVVVVRVGWLSLLAFANRSGDGPPPGNAKDVIILSWSGMRGLATLALALALPTTLADGSPFPERDQIIVTACAVLITTLVLPGLTLPWLVKKLDAAESHSVEKEMEDVLAQRGQEAALAAMNESPLLMALSPKQKNTIRDRMKHLRWDLSHEGEFEAYKAHEMDAHETLVAAQTIALDAAREEVLNARNEPDMDPEIVDKVLHRLDLRTRLIGD
jgi:CPA1 family monovalent cation:H+ antiporter